MRWSFDVAMLVDVVIGFSVLEAAVLVVWYRRVRRGVAPREHLPNMVSGLCLMLALRCHVHDAGAAAVGLCLLAAGAAHGADLALRWRREVRGARNAPADNMNRTAGFDEVTA